MAVIELINTGYVKKKRHFHVVDVLRSLSLPSKAVLSLSTILILEHNLIFKNVGGTLSSFHFSSYEVLGNFILVIVYSYLVPRFSLYKSLFPFWSLQRVSTFKTLIQVVTCFRLFHFTSVLFHFYYFQCFSKLQACPNCWSSFYVDVRYSLPLQYWYIPP